MSEPAISMREPPPVREDGRCAQCLKPRTMPKAKQRGVPPWAYEREPFCSNTCAKVYFGTQDTPPENRGRPPGMVQE